MIKYPVKIEKEEVKAAGIGLPISTKSSIIICRKINRMKLDKSKKFLHALIGKKTDINGKYFTKTCEEILKILDSAEKNAEYRGMKAPVIRTVCAEKGAKRMRSKRRRSFGSRLKNTNIKIILKEGKEKRKVSKDEHKK